MIDQTPSADVNRAVDFLVRHARNPNDSLRQARDKIRKRLLYAIDRGELLGRPFMVVTDEEISPGSELVIWARKKFPAHFTDFTALVTGCAVSGLRLSDIALGDVIPGNIDECQTVLMDMAIAFRALQRRSAEALREIERLRPIEAKYAHIRETNRRNAGRPRKL